ncbi:MAG: hypothetical protein IJ055_10830 [Oscillospiraceae bacterium]|nr:hypothetical protein [Oscillospiraceae bacterium]MBQ8928750.1 hypothetical protein [Oscillospiraceae bacterium]
MIQIITGRKGTGKTKNLIEKINTAVAETNGCLVCVEKGETLRRSISYKVRWVGVEQFDIQGYENFYGFIAGMLAGNYDIKEIFVDGILKIGGPDFDELGAMFAKLDALTSKDTIVTFTVSADNTELPESVTKYL